MDRLGSHPEDQRAAATATETFPSVISYELVRALTHQYDDGFVLGYAKSYYDCPVATLLRRRYDGLVKVVDTYVLMAPSAVARWGTPFTSAIWGDPRVRRSPLDARTRLLLTYIDAFLSDIPLHPRDLKTMFREIERHVRQ